MNSKSPRLDYLGDPLPEGFERWSCSRCTAGCNYEAMSWCDDKGAEACPFFIEKPDSNNRCFAFIKRASVEG
jgi:hypothetical protein